MTSHQRGIFRAVYNLMIEDSQVRESRSSEVCFIVTVRRGVMISSSMLIQFAFCDSYLLHLGLGRRTFGHVSDFD